MAEKKPRWLTLKAPDENKLSEVESLLSKLNLHTVCEGALCPNIGECFGRRMVTFMILGDICTRNCKFCGVKKGKPLPVDQNEPIHVAEATKKLGLKHVVITSVTRDDLNNFGAYQFAETIRAVKRNNPKVTVEVLIPDFQGSTEALELIVKEKPSVIGHNLETVPRLYPLVREKADFKRSLHILKTVKALDSSIYTKSGLMVGLGESEKEVIDVMEKLHSVQCDILTIGQYLSPSKNHIPVFKYVEPEEFVTYRKIGEEMGFKHVASGPLIRSSYNTDEMLEKLKTH